jgi:hypothetical protein
VQIDGEEDPAQILPQIRVNKPFAMAPTPLQPATEAYSAVLEHAGATRPRRDAVDRRIIDEVRRVTMTNTARPGIITDVQQVGGYPVYRGDPLQDTDADGIPDAWERQYGRNPNDPADAAQDASGDGYTNIEKYLNGLDPRTKINWQDLRNNRDPLQTAR